MSAAITPTPGRVVWYWPSANDGVPSLPGQPLAAIVASVHTDRRVNLSVIDSYGNHHARGNVSLIQPDDIRPQPGSFNFAEWMPYQLGQAKKTEEAVSLAESLAETANEAVNAAKELAQPAADTSNEDVGQQPSATEGENNAPSTEAQQ